MICISLITKNIEHFFRCFSAIQYSSGEYTFFSSVHHFLIVLFRSLESNCLRSLYILDISPLSDVVLVKIFSQIVDRCFVLLTVSFALQKVCNFLRSHLSILFLYSIYSLFTFQMISPFLAPHSPKVP